MLDYEYDYEDGEEYDYGSDNDGEAADDLIEIENAFYEGDGEASISYCIIVYRACDTR